MTAYASLADMLARFDADELVQLADAADVDDQKLADRVDAAVATVTATIDGYLAAKYQLPIEPTPPLVTEIACDLARHKLYRVAPPDSVKDARDVAMKQLQDIAKGVIKLDRGSEAIPDRPEAVLIGGPPKLFGRDNLVNF